MKKRVLIFGGYGQDGRILSEESYKDDDVFLMGRDKCELRGALIQEKIGFRYENLDEIGRIVSDFSPSHVYYLPAVHGPMTSGKNTDKVYNLEREFLDKDGLSFIMRRLDALGHPVRFMYTASERIFGSEMVVSSANEKFKPKCEYGESKAKAIGMIERTAFRSIIPIVAILYHHHSRYRGPDYAFSICARALADGQPERIYEDLEYPMAVGDFSSAHVICSAMSTLMDAENAGRHILRSGKVTSIALVTREASLGLRRLFELNPSALRAPKDIVEALIDHARFLISSPANVAERAVK